jgi:hypothetical protein
MKKFIIPTGAYIAIAGLTLLLTDTVARVYAHHFICFAVAFLLPSIWETMISSSRGRMSIGIFCGFAGMLLFDGTVFLVIGKSEFFGILQSAPWIYFVGATVFTLMSFCVAWAAAPLRNDLTMVLKKWALEEPGASDGAPNRGPHASR